MVMKELAPVVDMARLRVNKGARPMANPACFLKAGQMAQETVFYSVSFPSFLDDKQDWELVVDMMGHGKYPDVIQRSWQWPDILMYSMSTCQFMMIKLMVHMN